MASHLEGMKVPLDYIKRILNHSLNRGVTSTYTWYDATDEVRVTMEKWSVQLRDIIGLPPADNRGRKIVPLGTLCPKNQSSVSSTSSQGGK